MIASLLTRKLHSVTIPLRSRVTQPGFGLDGIGARKQSAGNAIYAPQVQAGFPSVMSRETGPGPTEPAPGDLTPPVMLPGPSLLSQLLRAVRCYPEQLEVSNYYIPHPNSELTNHNRAELSFFTSSVVSKYFILSPIDSDNGCG